jgi:AraC-like DNA-binding protein
MNQFFLQQHNAGELKPFSHINEFVLKRNNAIRLDSFTETCSECIRFYFVLEGKFNWVIDHKQHTLFPSDLAIVLPGKTFCAEKGYLDIGAIYWLGLHINKLDAGSKKSLGKWSAISETDFISVRKILLQSDTPVISKIPEVGSLLHNIQQELFAQELGFNTRVNHLLDELFILVTRRLTRQQISARDFPHTFLRLEETLRKNLSHHWTVEEMAALVGLGTTAFSDKVKNYTGFSPLNYLINIRISEAIRLLKKADVNVTDIALDTGFYSSQHFSTTFKKLTGYTPSQFRKNNLSKT